MGTDNGMIKFRLTQNPGSAASAQHTSSADQSNAWLMRLLPTYFSMIVAIVYQGITRFFDSREALTRPLGKIAPLCQVQAPASSARSSQC